MSTISQKDLKLRIEATLERFFADAKVGAQAIHPMGKKLVEAIGEFTLRKGAKRTRGILVLLGYLSRSKNQINQDILKIAGAYEILQSYLLIHDDIIDNDDERRGKPTLHKVFQSYAAIRSIRIREKIGFDLAIIVGDIASELVQRLVLSTAYSAQTKMKIITLLNQTLYTTYIGQVLDILAIPEQIPPLKSQWLRYVQKTAIYTIESPFMLGASIGKAKVPVKKFHEFAVKTGTAFQLADDVQNIFGNGMAARQSRVREGKITLLISLALQSTAHKERIIHLLKKKPKNTSNLNELKRLIKQSGGFSRAIVHIEQGFLYGVDALSSLAIPQNVQKAFTSLLLSLKDSLRQNR